MDIDQLEIDYNKCTRNIKSIEYKKIEKELSNYANIYVK